MSCYEIPNFASMCVTLLKYHSIDISVRLLYLEDGTVLLVLNHSA